jgi:hypothetical protein
MVNPVGRVVGLSIVPGGVQAAWLISQYSRAAEAAELGSQYNMMSSSISSRVKLASASPGVPQVSWNRV